MLEESSGVMEKKPPPRHSPAQSKNNGVISEKKSDYLPTKNGRPKRRDSNNSGRVQDSPQNPRPAQKYSRAFSDKRPRQRGYTQDRQSEEVVEEDASYDYDLIHSRKGNANHLLQFSFKPRGENGSYNYRREANHGIRSGGRRSRAPSLRYDKERFLQASCQFVVREDGEYSEQAINPDALVKWDYVELVRTFSTEMVTCPICLQVPFAGKITRCGHVYCWACILHYLHQKEVDQARQHCPICPAEVCADDLRSVQCIEVPDYKIGDEIEMKLMRKSKGSVYVSPKDDWISREGKPLNIQDGDVTKYTKVLLATIDQIQKEVIEAERAALTAQIKDAESSEVCYIEMAQAKLEEREQRLKIKRFLSLSESDKGEGDSSNDEWRNTSGGEDTEQESDAMAASLAADESYDGSKITTQYADAFEDETVVEVTGQTDPAEESEPSKTSVDHAEAESILGDTQAKSSPVASSGLRPSKSSDSLTAEEAADHLELPDVVLGSGVASQQKKGYPKDTYYFYQASSGQPIYLNSLNAQCLTKEYGSLENSPATIKATILNIERIFMTEDIRKRLRYLNHIPLTCEFHVVELRITEPVLSKEILRHFQPEFDKRRKARQRKSKEEKRRAKDYETELKKKTLGIYPEVKIPLDNLSQFPAPLVGSPGGRQRNAESSSSEHGSDIVGSPPISTTRSRNDSEGSSVGSTGSWAQRLKEAPPTVQPVTWGPGMKPHLKQSATMPELRSSPSVAYGIITQDEDDEEGGAYLPAPPIGYSWFDGMSKALAEHSRKQANDGIEAIPEDRAGQNGNKKKKKKKEKQLLFSTSMARKN